MIRSLDAHSTMLNEVEHEIGSLDARSRQWNGSYIARAMATVNHGVSVLSYGN
jgi:hypothetical protein